MISRLHKVLFLIMLLACVVMAAFLIRLRNHAQDRLHAEAAIAPAEITEGSSSAPRTVTLYVPNDLDASITAVQRRIAMPADDNAQARVLLDNLIAAFHASGSTHPINVASGVNEVYFLPLPKTQGHVTAPGRIAVVDLSGSLAAAQPSGIEPETLTLLAMMATLHANMPSVAEVHFLVDGQPRETLAGHADLTRTYLASDAGPEARPEGAAGQTAEAVP